MSHLVRQTLMLIFALVPLADAAQVWSTSFADFNNFTVPNPQVVCSLTNAPCAGSVAVPGTGMTMSFDSYGAADFGRLRAYGAALISGPPGGTPPDYAVVRGRGAYQEVMTVWGGPVGSSGSMSLRFTVTGTATISSAANYAGSGFNLRLFQPGGGYTDNVFEPGAGGVAVAPAIPIVFGQPFEYAIWFTGGINIDDFSDGSYAVSDFYHTATLTGIGVLDANQAPLASFQIQADSGTVYTANGVVPEPGTFLLIGAAVPCLLALVRRRVRK